MEALLGEDDDEIWRRDGIFQFDKESLAEDQQHQIESKGDMWYGGQDLLIKNGRWCAEDSRLGDVSTSTRFGDLQKDFVSLIDDTLEAEVRQGAISQFSKDFFVFFFG